MMNSSKIMFLITMIISMLMIISSENWISVWMSLEINMLSFIPMMKSNKNKSSEAMMSYFLIQATSSIMFLMIILMNPMLTINKINKISMIIITMAIGMKMGIAPLNMWIVQIIEKLSWESCMLILSVQKINPLWTINLIMENYIMITMSLISCLVGSIGGINQTSMKKIMTFSSINHLGWMMFSMKNSTETWIKYFMIYMIITITIMYTMKKNSILHINQMSMNMKTYSEKVNMIIMFMSIGGMPPTIGFMNKWMIIQENKSDMIIMTMIIMTSIITLYFYLRAISPVIMNYSLMNKWKPMFKKNKISNMINMNIITPIMIMFII